MNIENHSLRKSERPLVSVIVALYNGEKFIQGLLEDLEAQTMAKRIEIVIVETGSTTDEIKVIREFQKRFDNILYVRTSYRVNVAAACNFGIRIASGTYITLGPADDRRRHNSLEVLSSELEANHDVGLVYADNFVTNCENQTFERHIRSGHKIRPEFCPEIMLSGCHMGPQAMWRKSLHEEIGYFDEVLESATDYEFWCRIATRYPMKHVPAYLGLYFDNPKGIVNSNASRNHQQTREVQKLYEGTFPPPARNYSRGMHYLKPMNETKYVNICMVTFNRLEFTKPAIASILEFTCYPHVITVVDNGSTDGTVEYLQALKHEGIITNLILLKANVGVAKASNLAWSREPEAEYYMKFDNDIVLQKFQWLERMVEVMDAIPGLAMLAYNFEPSSYSIQTINEQRVRLKKGNLGGACVLIPKRTQQKLGFWCEEYGLYGEEDADYGLRLSVAGLKQAYMEDEEIGVHLPAGRAASIDPRTSVAEDGMEEHQHTEYRQFKDAQRRVNMEGRAKENFKLYQQGRKSLHCTSPFVETFNHEVIEPLPYSVTLNSDEDCQHVQQSRRRVSVIANDSFCGGIRLFYPMISLLEKKELTGQTLVEGNIWKGEVELPAGPNESLVVQRIANLIEPRLQEAKSQGTRIIHDFDDLLWKIPEDNQNYQVMTRPMLECFFRVMSHADCVTVSTEPLREALAALHIKATLLPNCMFSEDWKELRPHRRTGHRPRVGWVGQAGVHRADVAILHPLIKILGQEVEWVFLGEIPDVRGGIRFEAETHSMVPLQDFPAKLASLNLDLALAPLAVNEFNEAKSDLRVLQYGILGYPVVATDIFPYQTAPVTRVSNDPDSWARAIRDHINNPDASESQGETLKQWVLSHRMFDQWASRYQEAWLGEPIQERGTPESEHIPRVSVPESQLRNEGGKGPYDCSIIIPVFNQLDLTRQCLTHLANVTDGCSYEVIVVDNASTDGTTPFLSSLEGDIQIIRNDSNLGFAKACNQGTKAAKGKYVVFLHNDTIPQEGWLSPLLEEVERNADVAVVGSKLLFPDKTIQHAGLVISRKDFMPNHIFSGAVDNLPAVNFRREFQVVTAACMLVRRGSFDAVGGFDEGFIHGCEDVDFCLKIRDGGERVVYQPKSMLFHLEQHTPGRIKKDIEEKDHRRLRERWETKVTSDEDMYYVSEGYKHRCYVEDGISRVSFTPFVDEKEKLQWHKLERVQSVMLQKRYTKDCVSSSECETELRRLLSHVSQWPKDIEALRWAAFICHTNEFHEYESDFWSQILELDDDADARSYLVSSALKQQNFSDAKEHLQALLASHPTHGNGHFLQGVLFLQLTEYVPASESFRLAVEFGFDHLKAEKGLGLAYLGMGNADESWRVYDKILPSCPDDIEVINGLLQAGTVLERWEDLAKTLSHYLERNPGNLDMRFALASVAYRAGQSDQAQQQLDFLKLTNPDFDGLIDLEHLMGQAPSSTPPKAILKDYRCDANTKVWRRSEYPGIAYSDGEEIEQRLLRIVETSSDVSVMSSELASHCSDWGTQYHLSRQRSNLLRPFEAQLQGKQIFEIGAGCGAITRYLGEIGADVLALEGSPRRASIAALRCRDQANVTVMAEAIHEFQQVPQFDVVTLIGVLEYARKFFPGEGKDPVDAMLKYVTGFLKPGGRLIIAIENQLGLKYFAGFPEDHMGEPMFGIEEHYDGNNVVTFGRTDLAERARKVGLTESQWWYPFPDYKLPSLMVSEEGAFPSEDMDLFPLVRHACSQDPQYPSSVSFNQGRAWRPIMRNGLLREMANSFVVVASDCEIPEMPDRPVALHYATNRRPEYAKKVLFTRTESGVAMTHQTSLYPEAVPHKHSMMKLHLEQEAFIQGQLWQDRLVDIMTRPGWTLDQIQQWFQVWLKAFYSAAELQGRSNLMYEKVSGGCVDMTPRNLIVDNNGVGKFFDQEWELVEAIQVGHVVFRALLSSIGAMKNISPPLEKCNSQALHLIMKIAEDVGFSFSTQQCKEYMAFEDAFQQCVEGKNLLNDEGLSSGVKNEGGIVAMKGSPATRDPSPSVFECSIIIPVCNKLELTRQCLTHLADVTHGCTYEVIVVDNGSTDGTKEFLASLEGDIQAITNDSNFGFAIACNQGGRAAKGKYLVFLNNDTIPKERWLAALVDEVEQHSDVAIVGSKLLYPNNTIQHAGVVFSKISLTPYHIYNSVKSDFAGANIRQEFQAVTAACLLIRQEAFHSVGGFDEEFRNGFEDVDLCLKIRESGGKVIYQPKSVLYHLEEQTPGRKNPEAERNNGRLLMEHWADKIVVDEDFHSFSAGYFNRYSSKDGKLGLVVTPFKNDIEKLQWKHVKNVQELLLKKRYDKGNTKAEQIEADIRANLTDASTWPAEMETLKWAASICVRIEDIESECGFLKRILDLGEDREAREKLTREALKRGNLNEASQHVSAILTLDPHNGLGLWLQGILAIQSLDYAKATHSFQHALANGFDGQKTRLGLGMAWIGLGNAQNAWTAFQEVFVADADNKEAVNGLIQSGTMLEWWGKLQMHLTRYVDRNPAGCDMRFVLAGVCFRAGKIEESKKHYDILQMFSPEYDGLEELGRRLKLRQDEPKILKDESMSQATLYEHTHLRSYFQPPTGNTETYIRILPSAVLEHSLSIHKVLKDYSISGFGTGTDAVEKILSIIFQRQFPQANVRSFDMWDRVVALTVDCELVHGVSGLSFCSLQPQDLEAIDPIFAQQEGESRKEEISVYLNKLKNGESLGMPLYISGTILQYLGAPAESGGMYMLDGARRLSASALHHQERMPVIFLVFEEEFSKVLQEPVKLGIQHHIEKLAWFQNYHSFPFLGVTGQRSLQRFTLMDTKILKDSVILDFGCNLGQASLKAIQCGAKEVWGIEGMPDTIAVANEIKDLARCENLHYLHVDFNDPQFDQEIDRAIPKSCDYAFFFSVYRTKELLQRDRLFRYILQKVSKGVFFEGHAHPKIDTIDYYEWLFESFNVPYTFLGFSERQIRPLFFLDLEERSIQENTWDLQSTPGLHSLDGTRRLSQEDQLIIK